VPRSSTTQCYAPNAARHKVQFSAQCCFCHDNPGFNFTCTFCIICYHATETAKIFHILQLFLIYKVVQIWPGQVRLVTHKSVPVIFEPPCTITWCGNGCLDVLITLLFHTYLYSKGLKIYFICYLFISDLTNDVTNSSFRLSSQKTKRAHGIYGIWKGAILKFCPGVWVERTRKKKTTSVKVAGGLTEVRNQHFANRSREGLCMWNLWWTKWQWNWVFG
jgi:hypothetical protein